MKQSTSQFRSTDYLPAERPFGSFANTLAAAGVLAAVVWASLALGVSPAGAQGGPAAGLQPHQLAAL